MTTLTLNPRHISFLNKLIDQYLSDMRVEIRRTESFKYKDMLKRHRETLSAFRNQLDENQHPLTLIVDNPTVQAVGEVIDNQLASLHLEIRRAENFDYKEMLKGQREMLVELTTQMPK